MDKELENKLYEKYPQFFVNKDKTPTQSLMCFGIETGNGWYEILSSLCWMIKQHEDNIKWQTDYKQKEDASYQSDYCPVKFDQIKEKYGGLRIYFSGGDERVAGLVDMAEAISYNICETCGNKGEASKGGWIKVSCKDHLNL